MPPSGVVTTVAYRRFVANEPAKSTISAIKADKEIQADEIDTAFLVTPLEVALASEIVELARKIGAGRSLAVRSSATVEDLRESSFAGQYHSLLGVDSTDPSAVLDAVRRVWASLWHPAPCAYRRAFGIDEEAVAMAVVLMQMVPATEAGVVFTADPGGSYGSARVEAVPGLGEKLVSGSATPTAWVLPRDQAERPLPDFEAQRAYRALDLALEVEERAGSPQDVEWAAEGDRVWIVQARPITVVATDEGDGYDSPIDSSNENHELTTAGIAEMLPGVLPPLVWEAASWLVEEAFRRLLDDLGALPDDLSTPHGLLRRVRGRAVQDLDLLVEVAEAMPGSAPGTIENEYFQTPPARRLAAGTPKRERVGWLRSVAHDLRVLDIRHRAFLEAETVAVAVAEVGRKATIDLGALDDFALMAYRLRLLDLAGRAVAAELVVAAAAVAAYRRLELSLASHLGEAEAGHWLQAVTAGAGRRSRLSPDASSAVFAGPTWREIGVEPPDLQQRAAVTRAAAAEARKELETLLSSSAKWRRTRILTGQFVDVRLRLIRHQIKEVRDQLARREITKAAVLRIGGEVRRIHLELGSRLVAARALEDKTDVELLTTSELERALVAGRHLDISPQVLARRRRWRATYEAERPLPSRFTGKPESPKEALPEGDRLEGWAASPGIGTGIARVLRSPTGMLRRGEVLVAEATDASWSPLFVQAGGVVVERGGPLSHAAILARELGVPAVLNVQGATDILDGHTVTVDGDIGIVLLHRVPVDESEDATGGESAPGDSQEMRR